MEQLDFMATSTFGLEAVVSRELSDLGYEARIVQAGRILFSGDESAICRTNLWLRSADRVLLRVASFEAADFEALFERTRELPWERWLGVDALFPVTGRSVKSQLSSVPACQRCVKKAIVERLMSAHNTETLDETGPKYAVEIALLDNLATLTIDTSGRGLGKRGYRPLVSKAPLRETLAAGMVMLSFWRPDRPLLDPFCGSGTIPIEAALIGRNMAPGLGRDFVAESWPGVAPQLWADAREEARDLVKPALPVRIIGTDIDDEVLSLARYHAKLAGVADDIHFQQLPFDELQSSQQYGCVICNPPYGIRLGEGAMVEQLHRKMPDVLKRLDTWSHFILTAYPEFEALLGQKADRRRKFFSGGVEVMYYQFHGPRPARGHRGAEQADGGARGDAPSSEPSEMMTTEEMQSREREEEDERKRQEQIERKHVAAAFGGVAAHGRDQAEAFANRLVKRARHLRKWPARGVTCYRLYDRDIPEVPLAVDCYGSCLHMAEYDRPCEHTAAQHADWLDLMVRTAGEALDVAPADIFLKRRQRQRGRAQYERVSAESRVIDVVEDGLTFSVNLSDYVDTGLFLDHRITRKMVRQEAGGKRMLNLFAYTGAFTVYACAGGAVTTTVDLSNTYLDWARRNMAANGFTGKAHRFVRADAMSFLAQHADAPCYDLAVVDPPTFSNSKTVDNVWDIQRDHGALLARLGRLMAPGGVVFFSTNSRRFKLDAHALAWGEVRDISKQTVPEDFRNRRIHRCWRIVKLDT